LSEVGTASTSVPARGLPPGVTLPIPGALLKLALPVLASQVLRLGYQWVDALWVRPLGVEATAAVTTSIFVMWWVYSLNDVVAIGVTAYVSQLLGAGERRRAGVAAFHGLRGSALLGLAGTALGLFGAGWTFSIMSPERAMVDVGSRYLGILLAFAPLPMMGFTCESVMRASGDTRTPFFVDLLAVGLNAALAPFLIYGWGPFPELGVAGAAWATVSAWTFMVASYLWLALRGHRAFPLAIHADGPPVRLRGMMRVGVPAAIIGMMFSVVYIMFARAASHFGPAALAVVGIVNRVEAVQFITSLAIGTAGAALVGQNLGANRADRAEGVIRTGLRWNLWISGTLTLVLLIFPATFLTLFTRDPEVLRQGVPYMRIITLCLVVNGMEIVVSEAILGSGHTRVISWIFSSFSLLRIPLALWSPQWGLGVLGIAWIITGTCIVRGLIIVAWARRGTWKHGLRRELQAEEGIPGTGTPPTA
jgi:putative MATE family efflux protein